MSFQLVNSNSSIFWKNIPGIPDFATNSPVPTFGHSACRQILDNSRPVILFRDYDYIQMLDNWHALPTTVCSAIHAARCDAYLFEPVKNNSVRPLTMLAKELNAVNIYSPSYNIPIANSRTYDIWLSQTFDWIQNVPPPVINVNTVTNSVLAVTGAPRLHRAVLVDWLKTNATNYTYTFLKEICVTKEDNKYTHKEIKLSRKAFDNVQPGHCELAVNNYISTKYNEHAVAIVTETMFRCKYPNISEKILQPIINLRPFVLVAPAHTLRYVKQLGFKTFDKWWSEEYDNIDDHVDRMHAIFDVITYINSKPIDELKAMLFDMRQVLIHNAVNLTKLKKNPRRLLIG
jgi:hypothetical protein